jgi:hypothetical protein
MDLALAVPFMQQYIENDADNDLYFQAAAIQNVQRTDQQNFVVIWKAPHFDRVRAKMGHFAVKCRHVNI